MEGRQPVRHPNEPNPEGKGVKRRKREAELDNQASNITLSNRFDALSDGGDDDDDNSTLPRNSTEKVKPPPAIVLYHYIKNHSQTFNKLREQLTAEFDIKYKGDRIIILTKNIIDYKTVLEKPKENNLDHHTYTVNEERPVRMVLRNVPPNILPEEIERDINAANLTATRIVQMSKKCKDTNTLIPYPMFIISFPAKTLMKDIYKVKKICHCIVIWQVYKNVSGVKQCYNCQSFGHTARNCFRASKCVKCDGTHSTKNCIKAVESKPTCTNCGGEHPSNHRLCPVYLKQINLKASNPRRSRIEANNMNHNNPSQYQHSAANFPPLRHHDRSAESSRDAPAWPSRGDGPSTSSSNTQSNKPVTHDNISIGSVITELKVLFGSFDFPKIKNILYSTVTKLAAAQDNATKVTILFEGLLSLIG